MGQAIAGLTMKSNRNVMLNFQLGGQMCMISWRHSLFHDSMQATLDGVEDYNAPFSDPYLHAYVVKVAL